MHKTYKSLKWSGVIFSILAYANYFGFLHVYQGGSAVNPLTSVKSRTGVTAVMRKWRFTSNQKI